MELKTIAECDKELDYLDKIKGSIKWFLEHSEGQLKYYRHLVEEYNRQIFNNRVEYEKVELRKKELCEEQSKALLSSNVNSFPSNGASIAEGVYEPTTQTTSADLKSMLTD